MSTLEIQSAIGDTLLQVVLQQRAQAKKYRQQQGEQLLEKQAAESSMASKVYAKAA